MARKVTIAAFERWVAEEGNEERVLTLIAGGKTLRVASLAVKQPYTCLHAYFHGTPERLALYETARKSWADLKQDEAMEIADGVKANLHEVAKAKLQVEVRETQAKAFYRERWGETLTVKKDVTIGVDQALLGKAVDLLLLPEKVVEGVELAGEASTPALPAARPPVELE